MEGNCLSMQLVRSSFPTATNFEGRYHLYPIRSSVETEPPQAKARPDPMPWVEAEVGHIAFSCTCS